MRTKLNKKMNNEKFNVGVAPLGDPLPQRNTQKSNIQHHTSNLKNHRGITLIALIITIIILLILAVVSIKIATGEGLIAKAQSAKDTYTVSDEKEKITLGYSEYKISKANGESVEKPTVQDATVGDLENGIWKITFTSTQNEYSLKEDGTIIEDAKIVETEKEKIKLAYEEINKEDESMTEDQTTLYNYFSSASTISELQDTEKTTDDVCVLKDIGISFTENNLTVNYDDETIAWAFDYNGNNYILTTGGSDGMTIEKLEQVSDNGKNITIIGEKELTVDGADVTESTSKDGWVITFTDTQHIYKVDSDGTITGPKEKPRKPTDEELNTMECIDADKGRKAYIIAKTASEDYYVLYYNIPLYYDKSLYVDCIMTVDARNGEFNSYGYILTSEARKAVENYYSGNVPEDDEYVLALSGMNLKIGTIYENLYGSDFGDAKEYTGKVDLSEDDFTDGTIYSQSYLEEVINTFNIAALYN